jgi:hypothetical protein
MPKQKKIQHFYKSARYLGFCLTRFTNFTLVKNALQEYIEIHQRRIVRLKNDSVCNDADRSY